jgi:hypothetical protein
VKNGNKEEDLWFDKSLNGLIKYWENMLEGKEKNYFYFKLIFYFSKTTEKKLKFGWWNPTQTGLMSSGQISEMLTVASFCYQPGLFLTVYSFRRLAADCAVQKKIEADWAHFARTSVAIVEKHYATNTRYDSHEMVKKTLNEVYEVTDLLAQIDRDFAKEAAEIVEESPIKEILYHCYLDYNQPVFLVLLKNNTLKFFNNVSFASKYANLFRRYLFVQKGFRNLPISHFLKEEGDYQSKDNNATIESMEKRNFFFDFPFFSISFFFIFLFLKVTYPNKPENEWILEDFLIANEIFDETKVQKDNSPDWIPPPPPVFRFDKKVNLKKKKFDDFIFLIFLFLKKRL